MSIFNFGKKKDEEKAPECTCNCACSASKASESPDECCAKAECGICCVKVLGAGCKSCHEMYENARQAVKALGLDIEVEYVTDMQKIMEYGVMSMPALAVNEKIVSAGRVLKAAEIEKLLSAD